MKLGVKDYTRIKTQERPRVGLPGAPIAEVTKLVWIILSPGKENASTNILFSKTSLYDYKNFCSLGCLGIEEKHETNNESVYGEFRKQLGRDSARNYGIDLIWKENHSPLSSNEVNSLGTLHSLKLNSHLTNLFFICFNDSLSKEMKNASYFILKSLFVLKIFKFLSRLFGHVEKAA